MPRMAEGSQAVQGGFCELPTPPCQLSVSLKALGIWEKGLTHIPQCLLPPAAHSQHLAPLHLEVCAFYGISVLILGSDL